MPLHHISLAAPSPKSYAAMRNFYNTVLTPLGYSVFKEQDGLFCGWKTKTGGIDFWLHAGPCGEDGVVEEVQMVDPALTAEENKKRLGARTHLAFEVGGRAEVEGWWREAVKAGGIPNGEPGERPEYVKGYYAAFVLDPLGNNVEVVYFNPWWLQMIKAAPGGLMLMVGAVAGHFAMGYAKRAGWA